MKTTLLLAALLTAGAAFAQTPPAAGRPGPNPARQEAMQAKMKAAHDAHLAKLHDALKLTAAQEGAWTTFANSMSPMQPPAAMAMTAGTAPERADKMVEHAQAMLAAAQSHAAAVKTFYAVLTADQQKIFDASMLQQHGRMMGGMKWR